MGIGAGLAIAGVAGAAGAIGGGLLSSSASKSAAKTQADAANLASQRALDQYKQTRADLSSWRDSGNDANNMLATIINRGDNAAALKQLEGTPGYQFALQQGLKSVQNGAAARGLGVSGAAMKGAANFAEGLAQQTYVQNLLNPLMQMSQLGENAAVQTGNMGQGSVNAANNALLGGASAQAAGQVGSANALSGALGQIGQLPMQYLMYNKLLGGGSGAGASGGTADSLAMQAAMNPSGPGMYGPAF